MRAHLVFAIVCPPDVDPDPSRGEYVAVTGSAPELGEWNISRAPRLQFSNDAWKGNVDVTSPGGSLAFFSLFPLVLCLFPKGRGMALSWKHL